jgi:hypothetical protein
LNIGKMGKKFSKSRSPSATKLQYLLYLNNMA